ncbi:MAG: pyruvate formate lyase family protein [Desulfobacterales bacterium]
MANPTFAFRWHPKVSDEVMREILECIRQGLGYPAIRHDPVLIANSMHWHGHPIEEARLWVHQALPLAVSHDQERISAHAHGQCHCQLCQDYRIRVYQRI